MTGFDFLVDVMVTGTVLGLDHTSTPTEVHRVFGGEFEPPLSSFGLVEFGWHEREVVFFGAQVHRLDRLTHDQRIEPVLVERYGAFPDRVDIDDLRKAVAGRGFPLEEQPCHDEDYVEFRAPVSHMGVVAERGTRDVVKLLGPSYRSPWRRFSGQEERFTSYVKHLLPLSDGERETWYAKRAEDDPDWWDCLAATAARKTGGTAETTRQWHRLRLAIHRAATERGVYPAGEAAMTEVGLLLAADLAPDDAVRAWLAAANLPDDIAGARRLRDQIHEVERARPHLTDPDTATELHRWITEKPHLLAD
jgi:hypothetical protein